MHREQHDCQHENREHQKRIGVIEVTHNSAVCLGPLPSMLFCVADLQLTLELLWHRLGERLACQLQHVHDTPAIVQVIQPRDRKACQRM
jgi:hypothetical protein